MKYEDIYNEEYYKDYSGLGSYRDSEILKEFMEDMLYTLVTLCKPNTMLDVGCAMGFMVDAARKEYDIEAYGLDVSPYAIQESVAGGYCLQHDATKEYPFTYKFDLVFCIEMVEHLAEEDAKEAIKLLCNASGKYIYFSSSPDDDIEITHQTVRSLEFWEKEFNKHGFIKYKYLINNPVKWGALFVNKEII